MGDWLAHYFAFWGIDWTMIAALISIIILTTLGQSCNSPRRIAANIAKAAGAGETGKVKRPTSWSEEVGRLC